jgi:hypothetical protein
MQSLFLSFTHSLLHIQSLALVAVKAATTVMKVDITEIFSCSVNPPNEELNLFSNEYELKHH